MCWYWWPSAKFPVRNVLDLRKCNIADECEDAIFTCEDKLLMANDDCDDDALTMWWPSVRNVLSLRKFLMHSSPMSSPLHTTCTAYLFIMMTMMIMMILPWLNKYQSLQELRNCPNVARDVMESLKILTFPWLVFGGHLMSLDSWSAYNTRLVAVEAMQFLTSRALVGDQTFLESSHRSVCLSKSLRCPRRWEREVWGER